MSEETELLKRRTMRFALDVCAILKDLSFDEPGPTAKRQLANASTGVAFNYRSACRSRSHTEFTARMGVVDEEADESVGWLEFIYDAQLIVSAELDRLLAEARELSAIMSASVGTARYKERNRQSEGNKRREGNTPSQQYWSNNRRAGGAQSK